MVTVSRPPGSVFHLAPSPGRPQRSDQLHLLNTLVGGGGGGYQVGRNSRFLVIVTPFCVSLVTLHPMRVELWVCTD